jgi:hypothetical protein
LVLRIEKVKSGMLVPQSIPSHLFWGEVYLARVCISSLRPGIKKMRRKTGHPAISHFKLKRKEFFCIQVLEFMEGFSISNL